MSKKTTILYNSAELERQRPIIAASARNALKSIIAKSYPKAFGLKPSDPPELWHFALGKGELRSKPLTKKEQRRLKELTDHIRRDDPTFDATYKPDEQHMAKLAPSLTETVQGLAARAKNDAELAGWLSKLLALHKKTGVTRAEFKQAGANSDLTIRLMYENWIQDPPGENWAIRSFCFFSDRALAKWLYYFRHRKQLPLHKETAETERIKQIRRRLRLEPGKPRIFKDVEFKAGHPHLVPLDKAASPKK